MIKKVALWLSRYYSSCDSNFDCYNGCCGYSGSQYCCSAMTNGDIAGIAFGSVTMGLVILSIHYCIRLSQRKTVVVGHDSPRTQVQAVSSNIVLAAGTQPPSYPTYLYPPNIHQQTTSFSTGNSAFPTAPSQISAHEKSQPLPPADS